MMTSANNNVQMFRQNMSEDDEEVVHMNNHGNIGYENDGFDNFQDVNLHNENNDLNQDFQG